MDMEQAACKDVDPDLFFPEGKNKREQEHKAKQVCGSCPIITNCLQFAIDNNQIGIWGGTTDEDRKYINLVVK